MIHPMSLTEEEQAEVVAREKAVRMSSLPRRGQPVATAADLPQTDDIAELCRAATPAAIRRLVEIALTTESEAVAVAAIKEINDRGWGKAAQAIKGDYQFTLIVNTGVNAPAMLAPIEGAVLPAVAAQIASDVAGGSE